LLIIEKIFTFTYHPSAQLMLVRMHRYLASKKLFCQLSKSRAAVHDSTTTSSSSATEVEERVVKKLLRLRLHTLGSSIIGEGIGESLSFMAMLLSSVPALRDSMFYTSNNVLSMLPPPDFRGILFQVMSFYTFDILLCIMLYATFIKAGLKIHLRNERLDWRSYTKYSIGVCCFLLFFSAGVS
jgi:hypothetical protein